MVEKEEGEEAPHKAVTSKPKIILREWPLLVALLVVLIVNAEILMTNAKFGKARLLVEEHLGEVEEVNCLNYQKMLELQIPMVYQHLSNDTMPLGDCLNQKHIVPITELPPAFEEYEKKIQTLAHTSLCELELNVDNALNSKLDCSKVLGGILLLTLPQASEQLDVVLKAHVRDNLEEFIRQQRDSRLLFIEVNYAYERIRSVLMEMKQEYKDAYKRYLGMRNDFQNTNFPIYGAVMVVAIGAALAVTRRRINRRGEVGVRYFKILPTKLVMQEKVIKDVRSKEILNNLQEL